MAQIVGHLKIIKQLKRQVMENQISHAYLFSGISGIGKKKIALEFAAMILCIGQKKPCGYCFACKQIRHQSYPDLLIIEPEKNETTIKIKQIREMINELGIIPYSGKKRIIILEQAEKMTIEAQNSLLKSLEEPLGQNVFLLITEYPKKLLPTVRSRCQSYHFLPLSNEEMTVILQNDYNMDQIKNVLPQAKGSPGEALYLLKYPEIQEERTEILRDFYKILTRNEIIIFSLAETLAVDKEKSQKILNFLIHFLYEVRLIREGYPLPDEKEAIKAHHAFSKILKSEEIYGIIQTLFEMMENLQYNINLRLQWEKCLIKIVRKE